MPLCKNGLHEMLEANVMWKPDKRLKSGGTKVCAACHRENHRLASERRRAGWRNQNAKRYDKVRGRKYRGPNQLVQDAALRIISEDLDGDNALRVAKDFAYRVAAGRLRFTKERDREPTEAEVEREVLGILEVVTEVANSAKKNPFKHLHVKPEAEAAWDRFNAALNKAAESGVNVPNCRNRSAEFVDYDENDLPSAEDAYRMCHGDESNPRCPVLELCAMYAEQDRPAWGVWAGAVFLNGEHLYD